MNSATRSSPGKGKTGKTAKTAKAGAAGKAEKDDAAKAAAADNTVNADSAANTANTANTGKTAANAGKSGDTAKASKAAATANAAKEGGASKAADTADTDNTGKAAGTDKTAKTKAAKTSKVAKAGDTANASNVDKAANAGSADNTAKAVDTGKVASSADTADKAGKSGAAKATVADTTAKAADAADVAKAGADNIADTADAAKTGKDAKASKAADTAKAGKAVKADETANAASAGKTSGVTDTVQADAAADTADTDKAVKADAANIADTADTAKAGGAGKAGKSGAAVTAKAGKAVKTGKGDVAVIVALGNTEEAAEMLKCLESQTLPPKKTVFALAADAEQGRALQKMLDASKLPHTELLRDEKLRGEAGCWNAGAEHAGECEFLYFLKAGYMPDAFFLQRAAERLQGNTAAVAASVDYLREHEERQTLESGAGPEQEGPFWLFQNGADLVPRTLFRSAAYRSFYGFNLEAGNARDFEFCLLIAKQGDWLYAADCAVRAVEDEYARSADADDERDRDYALLCEMYFDNFDFRGRIPKTVYRALFARKWHRAAQWMLAVGRFTDARDCLRRSLAWKILGNPALWRLMVVPAYKSALLRRRLETARRKLSAGQSPLPAPPSRF